MCVVFYSAYTFPNRKVKSGVGELREGSLARVQEIPALYTPHYLKEREKSSRGYTSERRKGGKGE